MDYEKEYKSLVAKVKKAHQFAQTDSTKSVLEDILPELRESEGERIRKAIVQLLKVASEAYLIEATGFKKEQFLSYLEKQKEPKHAPDDLQESFEEGQKSIVSNPEKYGLCKMAEWSEEDTLMLTAVIQTLERFGGRGTTGMQIDWLKSLRPQSREEIYQAAKHDLAIKFMNYLDENRPDGKMSLSNGECEDIDKAFKENDWEKIMRYVEKYSSSWKPSEEDKEMKLKILKYLSTRCSVEQFEEVEGWLNNKLK